VWLKVVRDPPALDVEGTTGRPAGMDAITFEDDHFVARPGEREGSCEPRDAAASDDAPHTSKLSGRGTVGKLARSHATALTSRRRPTAFSERPEATTLPRRRSSR
jgi:hypothetical protein